MRKGTFNAIEDCLQVQGNVLKRCANFNEFLVDNRYTITVFEASKMFEDFVSGVAFLELERFQYIG